MEKVEVIELLNERERRDNIESKVDDNAYRIKLIAIDCIAIIGTVFLLWRQHDKQLEKLESKVFHLEAENNSLKFYAYLNDPTLIPESEKSMWEGQIESYKEYRKSQEAERSGTGEVGG